MSHSSAPHSSARSTASMARSVSSSGGSRSQQRQQSAVRLSSDESPQSSGRKRCEGQCRQLHLAEDVWGLAEDELGRRRPVRRFTWRNANRVQVQAVTLGAAVTSVRYPDRKGQLDDVALGYEQAEQHARAAATAGGQGGAAAAAGDGGGGGGAATPLLAGTVGRCSGVVVNATYVLKGKQRWLRSNWGRHHRDGGLHGYHRRIWDAHVQGTKVVMSLADEEHAEGYGGCVLCTVTFELTPVNEFRMVIEARTTEPTLLNLSNLLYVNLAGHYAGADEIYRSVLTLNCDCYTKQDEDGLPTGQIANVVHTRYDFQVPRVLGQVMGCSPRQGYNQTFCVNRGVDQGECFVARLFHPRSGRILEVYSNQPGVRLDTADGWSFGRRDLPLPRDPGPGPVAVSDATLQPKDEPAGRDDFASRCLMMANRLHAAVMGDLHADCQQEYMQLRDLIVKVQNPSQRPAQPPKVPNPSAHSAYKDRRESAATSTSFGNLHAISPAQDHYLRTMLDYCEQHSAEDDFADMSIILKKIIVSSLVQHADRSLENLPQEAATVDHTVRCDDRDGGGEQKTRSEEQQLETGASSTPSEMSKKRLEEEQQQQKEKVKKQDSRVRGKGNAVYQQHGGVAIQTQNYPNAVNFKDFPKSVFCPGETYRHTVTYKFWVRTGQPAKWLRRNRDV